MNARWLPLAVGALLLVAPACSGDDDSSSDGTDATSAPAPSDGTSPPTGPPSGPTQPSSSTSSSTTTSPEDVPATDAPEATATTVAPTAPPATTTTPGSTVAPGTPQETLASVPIDEPIEVDDATIAILSVEEGEVEARLPGEIAGPAAVVTVEVVNDGADPIDLTAVTVNLADAQGAAASPLTTDPAEPMTGTLDPGDRAEGTYVFSFPEGSEEPVRVEVSYTLAAPVAVFVGPVG